MGARGGRRCTFFSQKRKSYKRKTRGFSYNGLRQKGRIREGSFTTLYRVRKAIEEGKIDFQPNAILKKGKSNQPRGKGEGFCPTDTGSRWQRRKRQLF